MGTSRSMGLLLGSLRLMLILAMPCASALAADDDLMKELNSDKFFSDETPTFSRTGWTSDIGGGISIPLSVTATFPAMSFVFLTQNSILEVVSKPIQKSLQNSYSVEATISRRVNDWMSLGGQVGYSIGHGIAISQTDLQNNSLTYFAVSTDNPFKFQVDYSLNVLSFTPIVKVGPGLTTDESGWKPYALFGIGGDSVAQNSQLTLDGFTFKFNSREDLYFGGTAGGGLAWKNDHFSAGIEVRYHKVFNPGEPLSFLMPEGRISYAF